MFKWCMKKNPWFNFDQNAQKHQKPQISKNAKIPKKMHERCMKSCNLMKKKGKKCLTISFWRKPLNLWPRKMTKKKKNCEKGLREESERKTRNSLKVWSNSYVFWKYEIWSVKRNWEGIEMFIKISSTNRRESSKLEL